MDNKYFQKTQEKYVYSEVKVLHLEVTSGSFRDPDFDRCDDSSAIWTYPVTAEQIRDMQVKINTEIRYGSMFAFLLIVYEN